jgi:hypothetical protein
MGRGRLSRLWQRLTRRRRKLLPLPFDRPDDEPALVLAGPPRRPRPSLAAEAEPERWDFDDHAGHPREG